MTDTRKLSSSAPFVIKCLRRIRRSQDGSAMVEMALVCAFVYLPMLFGIFQLSYGLYIYNYVCNVAHQASRYAAVRGSTSCIIESDFVACNLSPGGSTNPSPGTGTPLQNYVQSFGYAGIDPANLTVTPTWYSRTNLETGFSTAQWNTPCTASSGCNAIGNGVSVAVVYQFPLNIPFWGRRTLPITGISMQMITE